MHFDDDHDEDNDDDCDVDNVDDNDDDCGDDNGDVRYVIYHIVCHICNMQPPSSRSAIENPGSWLRICWLMIITIYDQDNDNE